ncbi:MAG: hypothetical protein JSV62_07105 [Promethearchaeota archaeon]|nr:MAG: hypothetical protein JSV62_07105 [Candidatus Lokiarchaeota archaeon]
MDLDDFTKCYLCLGLRINQHINGYVEHYYGPSEFKDLIKAEGKVSPIKLIQDCKNLICQLKEQGFEEKRQRFLEKTLVGIQTILRILNGEKIPYLEQVEKLFDFKPRLQNDNFFFDLTSQAEKIYKGDGNLSNRIKNYAQRRIVPPKNIKILMLKAINIAKKRTIELFPDLLPLNEKVILNEVKDKSWPMYNWYLGNYTSKIDINISTIYYWTSLLNFACHEGYPGHHMESAVRDLLLFHNKGYFETSILMIYTPEMVIHEGLGELAERILFNPSESNKILLDEFCPNPSIEDDIETLIKQNKIRDGFRVFNYNLAYYKYVKGWNDDELTKYSRDFKVIPEIGIKAMLRFISDKIWAPYIPVYQGERLIIEKFGKEPTPRQFQELMVNQTLPSDLV